jgi:PhoD-like phosphatase
MARLVVGPLLRYTGSTQATVWVETDEPCEVAVLGHRTPTFHVEGHHYALVVVDDLEPASVTPYEVLLDGERAWPPDDGRPPSVIRTRHHERRAQLVFGSCRVGAPERPPFTLAKDQHPLGFEIDALWAFSRRLQAGAEPWPDCLLLLGDQVYADEVSPETVAFIRGRRDPSRPPGEEVADFEEYTRLYREAWSDPDLRWLLSTVPSTMIFDDHDVHDDWNISAAWVREMRRKRWWEERIVGAFMAYWLYQHLGNLAPPELAEERLLADLRADGDGGPRLRRFAHMADRETAASRWAFHRDFGRSRLVVVDSRAARVLTEGRRSMVDDAEWRWIVEHARGSYDHLILASTMPVILPEGIHNLEAWCEAICAGAWGRLAARAGEWLRRALDLEHWPGFLRSFGTMIELLGAIARDEEAPATIILMGGDVHTAYIAEVALGGSPRSSVFQVVCSPFRNPLSRHERLVFRLATTRPVGAVTRALARAAGVARPAVGWRFLDAPTFDNSIATLELEERAARVTISRSGPDGEAGPLLAELHSRQLSAG